MLRMCRRSFPGTMTFGTVALARGGSYNPGMPEQTTAGCTAAHRPVDVDFPELTPVAARTFRWFAVAAIGIWVGCGLWPIAAVPTASARWTPASCCFGGRRVRAAADPAV